MCNIQHLSAWTKENEGINFLHFFMFLTTPLFTIEKLPRSNNIMPHLNEHLALALIMHQFSPTTHIISTHLNQTCTLFERR
jgi:hypothetical protein